MHYLVSSVYKISMTSPDNGITNFGGILPPSARVKPVFHLRIFSREANFSFVFIQLVPVERPKTNEKFASREKIRKWKTGIRKQKTLKISCFVIHVEITTNWYKHSF